MRHRGQSTIEYIYLTCIVVTAFLGMFAYFSRGMYGRLKDNGAQLTEGAMYSPAGMEDSVFTTHRTSEEHSNSYAEDGSSLSVGTIKNNISQYNATILSSSVKNESISPLAAEPERR